MTLKIVERLTDKFGYICTSWKILRKEHEWRKIKRVLVFEHNFYYLLKDFDKKDGPFCVNCADTHHEPIRMLQMPAAYICPKCKLVLTNEGQNASSQLSNRYRRDVLGEQGNN